MFSGKSEELIRRLRRAEIGGQRALIIKPLVDDRYDLGHVVSHAGVKMRAVTATGSAEVLRLGAGYDAVGIDEVQFFDEEIVEVCERLADEGRRVIVAGLDQDYRGAPFPVTCRIMGVAEFVTKNLAICSVCGAAANRSQRLSPTKKLIEVGTGDKYEARCRRCFRRS